jgi:hypothetical protein
MLVPTFEGGIRPGTILDVRRWNDIDAVGALTDDRSIRAEDLGPVEGPTPCLLADLRSVHELQVGAALELLRPVGAARARFRAAREAVISFDSPVTYKVSLLRLEDAVERDPTLWERNVGQRLRMKRARVVFQVVRGKLTFLFRGSGGAGIDLESTALRNLGRVKLGQNWSWRNEATLESKRELVLAVETARYQVKRRRFV